jgi:trans-aconitate methyltransferase
VSQDFESRVGRQRSRGFVQQRTAKKTLERRILMLENEWNTTLYERSYAFVWQHGASLLELLAPQPGERILDLGCGTGQLTEQIAKMNAEVIGIDAAFSMIEKAKQNYPQLQFAIANAENFQVDALFDAVFSNAVLHWVLEPEAAIRCIHQALKPGGRFVAEFGGKGNVQAIVTALLRGLESMDLPFQSINPWYFPSIGEYTTRLEQQGFDVTYAVLFDRPTRLEDGEAGLAKWLQMFASRYLEGLSSVQRSRLIQIVEESLKPTLYREGIWIADYRRIRVIAVKLA